MSNKKHTILLYLVGCTQVLVISYTLSQLYWTIGVIFTLTVALWLLVKSAPKTPHGDE